MQNLKRLITIVIFTCLISTQLLIDKSNIPIGFESAKAISIHVISLICAIVLLVELTFSFFNRDLNFTKEKLFILLGFVLILLLAITTTLNSDYFEVALLGNRFRFFGLLILLSLLIIILFFWRFYDKQDVDLYVNIFLIIVTFNSLIAFTQFLNLDHETVQLGKYVNGNFGQANFFADTAAAAAGTSFFLFFKNTSRKHKLYYLLISLFNAFLIFASQSAGGIGVFAALFLAVILNQALPFLKKLPELKILRHKKNDKTIFFIFLFLIFTLGFITFTFITDESRALTWDGVVRLITQKPFLGYGMDSLSYSLRDNALLTERFIDRAHNTYLDYIHNLGIISFIFSTGLGLWLSYKIVIRELNKYHVSIIVILLCFILSGIFHTKSIYHFGEFACMLGILIAILTQESKKSRNSFIAV